MWTAFFFFLPSTTTCVTFIRVWQSLIKCSECALRQPCESSLMPADLTRTNLTSAICGWASAKFVRVVKTQSESRRFIKTSTPLGKTSKNERYGPPVNYSLLLFSKLFLLREKTHTHTKKRGKQQQLCRPCRNKKKLLVRVSCLLPEAISSASFNYSFRHHTRIITSITAAHTRSLTLSPL